MKAIMKTLKERVVLFGGMLLLMGCMGLVTACGSDDNDPSSGGDVNPSVNIVGNSYQYDEYSIDDDGNDVESHVRLTFTGSSTCSVRSWGHDWIWHYEGYRKERYDETKSCSYIKSGSTVTLKNYPFYMDGGDMVLTVYDGLLKGDGNIYMKK